jgi:hypothetical protein
LNLVVETLQVGGAADPAFGTRGGPPRVGVEAKAGFIDADLHQSFLVQLLRALDVLRPQEPQLPQEFDLLCPSSWTRCGNTLTRRVTTS